MNTHFKTKATLTALLLSANVQQMIVDMNDQTGNLDNLLARGQRDDFFASRFSAVSATAQTNAQESLRIQMLLMTGGSMADNFVDFQNKASSSDVNPWGVSWLDSVKAALAEAIGDFAFERVIVLLKQADLPKGADDALPNSGLPAEIKAHIEQYDTAVDALANLGEDADTALQIAAETALETATSQLQMDFFHSFKSHTSLLNYEKEFQAVNYKGEVLHKDKDGNPKLVKVGFGWRADACRKPKKVKAPATPAASAAPAPTDSAPVPGDEE